MEEEKHNGWGGKRHGAGRPSGLTQRPVSVRIDIDLLESIPKGINKNGYINDSIREKMLRDGIDVSDRRPLEKEKDDELPSESHV